MKKLHAALFILTGFIVFGLFAWPEPANGSPNILTVKSSISLSEKAGDPSVIDSMQSIALEFSAPINPETVSGEVKLFRVSLGGEQEESAKTSIESKVPSILNLSKTNGARFSEGEEYRITISNKVKSTDGISLQNGFTGYFAVDNSFSLAGKGIAELKNVRSLIVCISDLHLGANDGYTECNKNREALVNFLDQVRLTPNVKELVIAGDLLDEWFIPSQTDTFNRKTQFDFVKAIAANNKTVIGAFNGIIKEGKIKVTYVPGNHDLLITSEDIQGIMPGISEARDVKGLGAYSPDGHSEIIIEHGHRYNFFCAPDPISNKSIAIGSILPPGYFFTRIATTYVVEGHPKAGGVMPIVTPNKLGESQTFAYVYWKVWNRLMTLFPIREGLDEKIIKTNIDGFTDTYSINDMLPYQLSADGFIDVKVYKGIQDTWDERQALNKVAVKIPLMEALTNADSAAGTDVQAVAQYFANPDSSKRVVVFGHTHEARIIPSENLKSQKTIYANSGTWIDKNKSPTMTFVVITPRKSGGSAPEFVNLYKYSLNGDVMKLDAQALTNLDE